MWGLLFLFDKKMNARKSARKSAANFFSLDYFIPLRNSTEMKIHFILSEKIEERLASFRLIISTAVEGCHYAWVRTELTSLVPETSDAVSL